MSAAADRMPAGRLRVLVCAADPARRDALRRLVGYAGHRSVDTLDEADVVLSDADQAGLEVLVAIDEGLTNKMIARRLGISLHTVKFHVESLFRKLGVSTRTEALAKARERRLANTIDL